MDEKNQNVNPENSSGNSKKVVNGNFPNYKKGITGVCLVIVVILLAIGVYSGFYTVSETESAVVTTFGKAKLVEEKGLHFKLPYIQLVNKVDTTVKGFEIGYRENGEGDYSEVESESLMITSDFNILDVDFYISYQVSDPIKYMYASDDPEIILKNIAMSCIRSVISAYEVDSAITTGKSGIQAGVKTMILENLQKNDIGLALVDAAIQDVEPPTDSVNNAFKSVETAKQGKESAINEANAYRNQKIPEAEANADKITQEAEAEKTARINEANGQVARFNAEYEEYKHYPLITKQRMFYETMQEVMPGLKIVIDDDNGNILKHISLDDLGDSANYEDPAVLNAAGTVGTVNKNDTFSNASSSDSDDDYEDYVDEEEYEDDIEE